MRCTRAVARGVIGCLLACGMFAGGAAAQSAEPVGMPMQLLQLTKPGKAASRTHARLAARSSTKSAARARARSADRRRIASRKKLRSHGMLAERNPHKTELATEVAQTPEPSTPLPAAPTATTVDAATLAPAPQTPLIVAPVAALAPTELVVDGQTVQVASADEVNEIDLAANDAHVASDAPLGIMTTSKTATVEPAEPAAKSDTADAPTQHAEVSRTSWFLQVMAALGGAVAAGSVAWFLIGSSPQRMYG